jgi:hypothetical protein
MSVDVYQDGRTGTFSAWYLRGMAQMGRGRFTLVITPPSHSMRLDNLRRRFGGDLFVPEAETALAAFLPRFLRNATPARNESKQASIHSPTYAHWILHHRIPNHTQTCYFTSWGSVTRLRSITCQLRRARARISALRQGVWRAALDIAFTSDSRHGGQFRQRGPPGACPGFR